MANDPAFLFYSSDFLTGTQFFTDAQAGQYIRLLCLQHQHGHLAKEDMLKICKRHDKDIFKKFSKDENSLYYNERLETEVVKRKVYSKSRSDNRKKKKICQSYVPHMENENENTIGNEGLVSNNVIPDFPKNSFQYLDTTIIRPPQAPTCEKVIEFFEHQNRTKKEAFEFFNYYEGLGWRKGISPIMNWTSFANTWIANIRPDLKAAKESPEKTHNDIKKLFNK